MHGLVVGHFQAVRGNHAVKAQLSRQTVIQVAVRLLLRIDLFCQGQFFTSVGRFNGYVFLRVGSCDAHSEGKHHDYFSHFTLNLVGCCY